MADRAVWSVILAVEPDSRSPTLGCNEPFNNESQGRADGHDKNDAVEHLRIDVAVEVASGDEPHNSHGEIGCGGGELQLGDLPVYGEDGQGDERADDEGAGERAAHAGGIVAFEYQGHGRAAN